MLHLLSPASLQSSHRDSAVDLLRSTMRILLYACTGFCLLLQVGLTATWPLRFGWNLMPALLLMTLACLLSLRLLGRDLILSHLVWQIGSAGAILVALAMFRRAEILFLLPVLPLMATVILGWQAGLIGQVVLVGLVCGLARQRGLMSLREGYGVAIILGGMLGIVVGWATTRALVTMTEWSFYSYKQAEDSLAQVREHRQQLARLVRSLDQAYHQLERTNASLVAAWRTAHEAERLKADFVANVSHELRTPLNLIIGYSEVIVTSPESYRGQELPGAYRRDITAIYNNARHLLALVDDVLELGRIEADKVAVTREAVDPVSLVAELDELVRDYVTAKGLELQVAVQGDLPALLIDRLRMRQVLLNLVVNAARFTERGHIRIEVFRRDDDVAFRVEDTGRGISPQELPYVFEPFHTTGPEPGGPWHSGSGLGLPISKKYVELHGGWIDVQSTARQGTTFTVHLPCRPYVTPPSTRSASRTSPSAAPAPDQERIVVVAPDDPLAMAQLQRHLEGFRFVGASTIDEAVVLAQELRATAVISATAEGPSRASPVPVICLPWPSSARIAANLGVKEFLPKPISQQQLFAAIDRLGRPVEHILIVDDDPELVSLFRRMLRARLPVQNCLEAYSAGEAIQQLTTNRPDLVLLDLSMPGEDGRTVIEHMTGDPALHGIPVFVVSGVAWGHLGASFEGPIQVHKAGGLSLREAIRTLGGILGATGSGM